MPEEVTYLPVTIHASDILNELCAVINDWATKKGWNEGADSVQRKSSDIALMHSELSECLEFVRSKGDMICNSCGHTPFNEPYCPKCGNDTLIYAPAMDDHVPTLTGEAAELADVLIRIFHYCGRRGIDLGKAVQLKHAYNTKRPYKHGKKL